MKKILGPLALIVGIIMILVSVYIKTQLEQGRALVGSAKEKVEAGKSLFSLSPYTKEVGKGITRGAERKIKEGEMEISKYGAISNFAMYSGIVLVIVGSVIFFLPKTRKKK
jgi:hypothetical protein